jgi:glycosyltransferase involved in cell wall biosynthesis
MPEVSVIIPTYNRVNLLNRAINSVLTQTFSDFELIVVDDSSEDNTKTFVETLKDLRIRYICHDKNRGAAAARNTGIRMSKGEYIAFLDSDDEWLPEKLEKQISKFEESDYKVGVVYSGLSVFSRGALVQQDIPVKSGNIYRAQLLQDYVFPTSTIMVRKKCLLQIGGFDETLPARQDYDLSLRLSKLCEFEFIPEPLVKVYWDSDNRVTNSLKRRLAGEIIINKIAKEIRHEPNYKQRSILSHQYFNLGVFCYYSNDTKYGLKYLFRAVQLNPFRMLLWRFWRIILITLLGYSNYMRISRPVADFKKSFTVRNK